MRISLAFGNVTKAKWSLPKGVRHLILITKTSEGKTGEDNMQATHNTVLEIIFNKILQLYQCKRSSLFICAMLLFNMHV